ncbi:MBL fold metallo-hydrolase [Lewinella sp. W8]|uniref:MBL fold metallo-hydrolase n=1 Tax=Lewinella sp. W8 TaxID=2528208 RepID=UPI0010681E44|nr:MBL fold metallo-hydrolase [Lewinella sp. W8]MTB53461.1 MBL fold metallo-hydrolase [Lewinella sp. W8]
MLITHSFTHQEVLGLKFGYQTIGRPRLFSHLYFVDGLLIDTGHSRVRHHVQSASEGLGIEQILITHHHEDHTGNLRALKARHQCPVYASPLCCQIMHSPPPLSLAQQITWGNRPPQRDLIPKVERIETHRFTFDLIPIPGHAPDMVALYEPNRRWLFSADLYINSYIDYFLADESMAEQIASTKRILELDFDVMFCGHKPQLSNAKRQLTKKLHFLEAFFQDVATLHQRGCSDREIFRRLSLKENWFVRLLSGGKLSKFNMVKSVIRDVENNLP